MFIEIDEQTSMNADIPVLYLEDVIAETESGDIPVTKIVFALSDTEPLYSTVERHHLAQLLGMERYTMPETLPPPKLPEDKMPHEGEDPADYLNRIMP
jgi:hypothetical protein